MHDQAHARPRGAGRRGARRARRRPAPAHDHRRRQRRRHRGQRHRRLHRGRERPAVGPGGGAAGRLGADGARPRRAGRPGRRAPRHPHRARGRDPRAPVTAWSPTCRRARCSSPCGRSSARAQRSMRRCGPAPTGCAGRRLAVKYERPLPARADRRAAQGAGEGAGPGDGVRRHARRRADDHRGRCARLQLRQLGGGDGEARAGADPPGRTKVTADIAVVYTLE